MDWDERREIDSQVGDFKWLALARHLYDNKKLSAWLSKRHPDQLPCSFEGSFDDNISRGSFNWVLRADFSSGKRWAVRFPRAGVAFPDAKVESEVATLKLIRNQTDVPVPRVIDWGRASSNVLGLGPFMIYEYIEGVPLADQLAPPDQRLFDESISEEFLRVIFRQIAHFMVQLSRIEFSKIGAIKSDEDDEDSSKIIGPPLSLKAQDLWQLGGTDIVGTRLTTFDSSAEYFDYLASSDITHLQQQPNSVDDGDDAREKFICWHAVKKLVPRFCLDETQLGPFKLICDDFGPYNMLVRSKDDPTIVAVLDWEYSYAGPAELFWCPPRWLIGQLPKNWKSGEKRDKLLRMYFRNLEIYIDEVLAAEKELGSTPSQTSPRPSSMIRRAVDTGSMWFYHISRESFKGPHDAAFDNFRHSVPNLEQLAEVTSQSVDEFVKKKMTELIEYERSIAEKKIWYEEWRKNHFDFSD